jgi:hypothetical protein
MDIIMTTLTPSLIAQKIRAGTLDQKEFHAWKKQQEEIEKQSDPKSTKNPNEES